MVTAAKALFFLGIPALLLLITLATIQYSQLHQTIQSQPLVYDHYTIKKDQSWSRRFDFMERDDFNQIRRKVASVEGNVLVIEGQKGQKLRVQYEYQVDPEIIESVTEVRQKGVSASQSRYVLVKYHKFVEIVYFKPQKETHGTLKQSQVCLQLPIESTEGTLYHIDSQDNIWIVTLSMNKIIFVQVYSCSEGRLIKEYRYALTNHQLINSLNKITREGQCMTVNVVTYGLSQVEVTFCPYSNNHVPKEQTLKKRINIDYELKETPKWSVFSTAAARVKQRELIKLVNYIMRWLWIDQQFEVQYQPTLSPLENIPQHFDVLVSDEKNNYIVDLARDKPETGIIALNKNMVNSKTPCFHSNDLYDELAALEMLTNEHQGANSPMLQHRHLDPSLNQTKKSYYKAIFKTFPNFKTQFMALGDKTLIYWPQRPTEERDYLAIRTKDGAIVSQKGELKGVYKQLPYSKLQVNQRIDDKALEVIPGVYELHIKQQALVSRPVYFQRQKEIGKVELVSLLTGKPVISHYIKFREGYRYVSSYILNSQWWIIEYSPELKASVAKKYQLFVHAATSDKIQSLEVTYGNLTSNEHINRQDDLAALMEEFAKQHQNGYMILSVFRCVDEYYYFEYTDAAGEVYGVARVHFHRMSNRRLKEGQIPANNFQRQMLLKQSHMNQPKYSTKGWSVAIKQMNIFKHMADFFNKEASLSQSWSSFCLQKQGSFRRLDKLEKYALFPQKIYAVGLGNCQKQESLTKQDIYAFNLRNTIIHGMLYDQSQSHARKELLTVSLSILPGYLLLCLLGYCCCIRTTNNNQMQKTKKKEREESKRQKKEKKDK